MARGQSRTRLNRRKFLTGMALAGAASAPLRADATTNAPLTDATTTAPRPSAVRPSAAVAAAETATPKDSAPVAGIPSSDFMVDVIKSLEI
jgi:acetolactate synthase I/II/III large subunit